MFGFGPSSQEGQAQARVEAREARQASNSSPSATRGNENDMSTRESAPEKHGWEAVSEKTGKDYGGNKGR